MILSVERARIYVASISYVANISNGCPISPAFCLVAVTAGDIALIDGDIRCEDSVQTVFTVVHLVCEPVQLTGVADLVVFSCLVQRCRLIVGAVLSAETVFVEVVKFILVDIAYIASFAAFSKVYHAVGVVQNRKSVCVLAA